MESGHEPGLSRPLLLLPHWTALGGARPLAWAPLWGEPGRWRGHSPEWVAARLEALVRRHGAVRVRIVDDNFLGGPDPMDRAGRIAAVLRERRLRVPFSIMIRADTVCGFPEAFRELKGVGLYHVFLGLESSDEDTLRKFGKGVSPEEGRTAVGILDRLGITVTCGTILFHPWMSRKSLLSDIGCLRGLMDEFKGACFLGLNELDIFEGTPISAGYRSGVLEWRCDWQAERPRMQEVYDRWRRIQASILFPPCAWYRRAATSLCAGSMPTGSSMSCGPCCVGTQARGLPTTSVTPTPPCAVC